MKNLSLNVAKIIGLIFCVLCLSCLIFIAAHFAMPLNLRQVKFFGDGLRILFILNNLLFTLGLIFIIVEDKELSNRITLLIMINSIIMLIGSTLLNTVYSISHPITLLVSIITLYSVITVLILLYYKVEYLDISNASKESLN